MITAIALRIESLKARIDSLREDAAGKPCGKSWISAKAKCSPKKQAYTKTHRRGDRKKAAKRLKEARKLRDYAKRRMTRPEIEAEQATDEVAKKLLRRFGKKKIGYKDLEPAIKEEIQGKGLKVANVAARFVELGSYQQQKEKNSTQQPKSKRARSIGKVTPKAELRIQPNSELDIVARRAFGKSEGGFGSISDRKLRQLTGRTQEQLLQASMELRKQLGITAADDLKQALVQAGYNPKENK